MLVHCANALKVKKNSENCACKSARFPEGPADGGISFSSIGQLPMRSSPSRAVQIQILIAHLFFFWSSVTAAWDVFVLYFPSVKFLFLSPGSFDLYFWVFFEKDLVIELFSF